MNKIKTIFMASTLEVLLVLCVGIANLLLKPLYYFCFYNVLYGILFSFLIPLFLLRKEKNILDFLGIKALGKKQVFILVVFIAFSVGGQIIPIVAMVNGIIEIVCRPVFVFLLTNISFIGQWGIWWTTALTWFCTALFAFGRFMSGKWKDRGIVK